MVRSAMGPAIAKFRDVEHSAAMSSTATPPAVPPSAGDRIIDVLEAFEGEPRPLTLDEVRVRTGLTRTTTHRILSLLIRRNWLSHSAHGYHVGQRVHGWGGTTDNLEGLRAAAAGPLNELHLASGAVAHLTVLQGSLACHVDKVGGRAWAQIPSAVGIRLPATETAAGHAILAHLTPEEVDGVVRGLEPSVTDRAALDLALANVRRHGGVAVMDGRDRPSQISMTAAAVVGPDGPVGALSVAWRRTGPDPARAAGLVSWAVRQVVADLYPHRR